MAQPNMGLGHELIQNERGMSYFTRCPLVFVGRLYGVEARQSAFSVVVGRLFAWTHSNIRLGAFEYSLGRIRIFVRRLSEAMAPRHSISNESIQFYACKSFAA